jgi:dTDP-4-dehydrorhamnose reductase
VKVLVCGAAGMLGRDVVRAAETANHEVVALDRRALDVTDASAVADAVERAHPHAVINCAAYTDVDGAESERDTALRVNGEGARNVAAGAAGAGAAVVYVSSDYVFDGTKGKPYLESDLTGPRSAYGASKLAGETETAAANPRHHIVRSSWLFGVYGPNFVATMLRLGAERDEVVVVRDQVGAPTYTVHLAEGLVRMLDSHVYGIHHMAAYGACSWYDFAVAIFARAGVSCRVLSTTTAELARPAPRPAYSVLGSESRDAIQLPVWSEGLDAYLTEVA